MSRRIAVAGRELLRALRSAGFDVVRVVGSHHFVRHTDGRATSVPVHGSRDLPIGTLQGILKDIEMDTERLRGLL